MFQVEKAENGFIVSQWDWVDSDGVIHDRRTFVEVSPIDAVTRVAFIFNERFGTSFHFQNLPQFQKQLDPAETRENILFGIKLLKENNDFESLAKIFHEAVKALNIVMEKKFDFEGPKRPS